jgi:hypothetical protein
LLDLRALLLIVSTLLLAVRALAKRLELVRHLLDRPSEIGELASDGRYVPWAVKSTGFYGRGVKRGFTRDVDDDLPVFCPECAGREFGEA